MKPSTNSGRKVFHLSRHSKEAQKGLWCSPETIDINGCKMAHLPRHSWEDSKGLWCSHETINKHTDPGMRDNLSSLIVLLFWCLRRIALFQMTCIEPVSQPDQFTAACSAKPEHGGKRVELKSNAPVSLSHKAEQLLSET